jgi:hypothetical protein
MDKAFEEIKAVAAKEDAAIAPLIDEKDMKLLSSTKVKLS